MKLLTLVLVILALSCAPGYEDSMAPLGEGIEAWHQNPEMPWVSPALIRERCNPTPRYLTKHEACVGCDGVCLGVEWPLGARLGSYAFACVSTAELETYPDAIAGRKTSLCRQAGSLFSYCTYMSAIGWQEIYSCERRCSIEPAI